MKMELTNRPKPYDLSHKWSSVLNAFDQMDMEHCLEVSEEDVLGGFTDSQKKGPNMQTYLRNQYVRGYSNYQHMPLTRWMQTPEGKSVLLIWKVPASRSIRKKAQQKESVK
jgi:hypothetical protein